jgi:hypothetical protein
MDATTKFLELKQKWIDANESDRVLIEQKTDEFFSTLTDAEKKDVFQAINDNFSDMHQEIAEIRQVLDVREKLSPILPVISVSYLAKNYFHKTPQWFYQRLNGNRVNGKPAKFSDTEIQTLNFAIQDIRQQLSMVQL